MEKFPSHPNLYLADSVADLGLGKARILKDYESKGFGRIGRALRSTLLNDPGIEVFVYVPEVRIQPLGRLRAIGEFELILFDCDGQFVGMKKHPYFDFLRRRQEYLDKEQEPTDVVLRANYKKRGSEFWLEYIFYQTLAVADRQVGIQTAIIQNPLITM